jgi:hypothetical protein
MKRIDKCALAIEKGIKYNPESGNVIGVKGEVLTSKDNQGYICFGIWKNNKTYKLYAHQFAWFVLYNECVDIIDHINQDKTDNSKGNLRSATRQLNGLNRNSKGFTLDIKRNKYIAQIMVNGKTKNLGRFDKKEDAEKVYIDYKKELIKTILL